MEPAGAERHRRSPEGVEARERRDQSNRHIERKSRCHHSPSVNWRRGRESNPRIEVLQTPTLPLGYPAMLAKRERRGRESNPLIAVLQTAAFPLGYPAL